MGIPLPPPWVLLSLILAFSKNIQDFKEIGSFSWALIRGRGEDAQCGLCTKIVTVVLRQVELDDMEEGGGVDCNSMCFRFKKCTNLCEKITTAMSQSTGFPCVAAGICPEEDEFGEVSCRWSYKSMGCEPVNSCDYKFPKCELKDGIKKWKHMERMLSGNAAAFNDAFQHRKRCSEPDAGPYCIREAEGLGALAEWGGLALTFVGGALFSIHAIETPGGDDDRQWLTFWMIMMLFFLAERFTDVLLSQMSMYYELKFAAIVWLMFAHGADKLYRSARKGLKQTARALPWLFPKRNELTEAEYIATLPLTMRKDAAMLGLRELFHGFTSDESIATKYDATTVAALWQMWNIVDPRYLTIHLLSASDLPAMDNGNSTDAYVVAYLVPPQTDKEKEEAEAAAQAELDEKNRAASIMAANFLARKMAKKMAATEAEGGGGGGGGGGDGIKKPPKLHRGWSKVRSTQRAAVATSFMQRRVNSWRGAFEALKSARFVAALKRAYYSVNGAIFGRASLSLQALKATMSGGPVGAEGQYGGVTSRVIKKTLHPVWNRYLELRLGGGELNSATGEYDNREAPYTRLRLEVWDRDLLSRDDFIGEVSCPLCPLMDARTHKYELPLTDPEGKSAAEGGVKGTIRFELKYES